MDRGSFIKSLIGAICSVPIVGPSLASAEVPAEPEVPAVEGVCTYGGCEEYIHNNRVWEWTASYTTTGSFYAWDGDELVELKINNGLVTMGDES